MTDIFPITRAESDALHDLDWESGYGWDYEFDWFRTPSAGPAEWVEDRQELMDQFLGDLGGIRQAEAARLRKERLGDVGPDLLAALEDMLTLHVAHHNHPIHVAAREIVAKARES